MFLKETLYVRPNTNITKTKAAIHVQDLTDKAYQVMDIWYTNDQVSYGIVNDKNQMFYLPFNCWVILDSKTKRLFHSPNKDITDVTTN